MEAALRELLGRGAQLLRPGGFGFRVFWVALLRFQGLGFRGLGFRVCLSRYFAVSCLPCAEHLAPRACC